MDILSVFIALQMILLFLMTFHDWVHLPPLTNIREMEKYSTKKDRLINSTIFFFLVVIPLSCTWYYQPNFSLPILIIIVSFYGLLSLGTILAWWIPYFFGSYSPEHKEGFIEYQCTHHFLPPRGDNVVPNTFHVILHLFIWACFGVAMYLLARLF